MDLSKQLESRPPGAESRESGLRELAEKAGLCEDTWKQVSKGLYVCPYNELYESIVKMFAQEYVCIYMHPSPETHLIFDTEGNRARLGDKSQPQDFWLECASPMSAQRRLHVSAKWAVRGAYPITFSRMRC